MMKSYEPSIDALAQVEQLGASQSLIETYRNLAEALAVPPKAGVQAFSGFDLDPGDELAASSLVVGVAIGSGMDGQSDSPGRSSLRIYVSEAVPPASVAEFVGAAFGINALSEGTVPFEVVHSGPIDALTHRQRMRPAPGGVSCGHHNISTGTLGGLARGRQAPRNGLTLILSNNHVLADVNAGQPGDAILQPGAYDGGKQPADVIAQLERYVTIDFARPNYVDCATAAVNDPASVRRDQLYFKNGQPTYFQCGTQPIPASRGLTVGKSGRTTQLTCGRVTGIGATIRVNMGEGRVAVFRDQIEIRGLAGDFSQGGDSGSLIWTWDEARQPVGLLFAGGGGLTFANPIHHVLAALDIDLL